MIRMRQGSIWLILVCVLAFYSSAEAKGFYFGASLGQGEAKDLDLSPIGDGSTLTGGTDGTDSGWKFFGGLKVFRFMNAEFAYRDYGQAAFSAISDGTGTIYAPGPVEGLADTTAISVSAMVVALPFFGASSAGLLPSESVWIFCRIYLGIIRWRVVRGWWGIS